MDKPMKNHSSLDSGTELLRPDNIDDDVFPSNEFTAVEDLIAQIAEQPVTPARVRALLRSGYIMDLTPGDQALLEWHLTEATGWSSKVVSHMSKDERNRRGGEYINDIDKACEAFGDHLDREHAGVVWCEGQYYLYPRPNHDQQGWHHYVSFSEQEIEQELMAFFKGTLIGHNANNRKEIMMRLQARFSTHGFFDDANHGLNVANGFLQLSTVTGFAELLEHGPRHKARTLLTAEYDQAAAAPRFMAAIKHMLPDESKQDALQELMGGILFNVSPRSDSSRRIALLYGAAGSGKSTFIRLVVRLMADRSVAVSPQSWDNEGSRARLAGAPLNVWYELDKGKALASAWAKQISSCEEITGRHPYGREFQFRPIAWHLFSCNEPPSIDDTTDAVARRFLLIRFEHALEHSRMDDEFLDKLEAEASGIINWAAAGAKRLVANGRFTIPSGQAQALLEMQHGDDPVVRFVNDELERAPGERLPAIDLQQRMRAYGVANGIRDWTVVGPGLMKRLSRVMSQMHGCTRGPSNSRVEYRGVRLKQPVTLPCAGAIAPLPGALSDDTDLGEM